MNQNIATEEKLKEKTLLIIRYFWLDRLFEIGKQLKLPYFDRFENYWEINHYQAALEVAKSIMDDKLLELFRKHLPYMDLILVGSKVNTIQRMKRET
jgi:hypothetical protein